MVSLKFVLIGALLVICVNYAIGSPVPTKNQADLTKSFEKFLQQDKIFQEYLQHGLEDGLVRNRRQTEGEFDVDMNEAGEGVDGQGKPGFFDRAAKFVVELLQRFLKWINTDSN